jgi:MFS family permease
MAGPKKTRQAKLDFTTLGAIPVGIWTLGFVSLLMDISSEMINALLPSYLVTVLGASMLEVGIIEGIAEATASITKLFSGVLSDSLGRRKLLAATGYGLAAFAKLVFPLAASLNWLIAARFIDRVGKGIRGAPRDALIADLSPAELRGASFGLRQSLDTVGAFIGPLLAIMLMWLLADNIRAVFWFAVVPAFLSLFLITYGVSDPRHSASQGIIRVPLEVQEIGQLGARFWALIAVATLFTLARFSEAFLILRAQSEGLALALVPAVLVVMNLFYALAAYPAGVLSDNGSRTGVLRIGVILLVAADLVLALAPGLLGVMVGITFWGLHLGFSQGLLAALVADTSPPRLRGTAFGICNLITGVTLLAASILAGKLWESFGAQATFFLGAAFAAFAFLGLSLLRDPISCGR